MSLRLENENNVCKVYNIRFFNISHSSDRFVILCSSEFWNTSFRSMRIALIPTDFGPAMSHLGSSPIKIQRSGVVFTLFRVNLNICSDGFRQPASLQNTSTSIYLLILSRFISSRHNSAGLPHVVFDTIAILNPIDFRLESDGNVSS